MAEGTLGLKGAAQNFIVKKQNHVNIIDFKENLQQESMKLQSFNRSNNPEIKDHHKICTLRHLKLIFLQNPKWPSSLRSGRNQS